MTGVKLMSRRTTYLMSFVVVIGLGRMSMVTAQDVTPPVLVSLSGNRSVVNVSDADQEVVFTWRITDDLAGFDSGFLRLRSPSQDQFTDAVTNAVSGLVSGDINDGIYTSTAIFPQFSELGIWRPEWLLLRDNATNQFSLHTPNDLIDLQALDIHVNVVIPEPSTIVLAAFGVLGLFAFGWRKRRKA